MVSFENAWDSTKNSHFGGPFSRQVWNRTQPRIPSERNAELQRRSRPRSGSKRRRCFCCLPFLFFVVFWGVFFFFGWWIQWIIQKDTIFYFKKKHMSSTWALSVWATKGRRHSRWEPWVSSLDCFGLSSFESLIWSLPSLERNVDFCDAWEL